MKAFIQFKKPIVVAINGPALGLGASILPLCDIVWASEKAWFQTPYATIRLTPAGCSSYTFPQILGVALVSSCLGACPSAPSRHPSSVLGSGSGPSCRWSPRLLPACVPVGGQLPLPPQSCCQPGSTQQGQQVDSTAVRIRELRLLWAAHSLSSGRKTGPAGGPGSRHFPF